MLPKIHKPPKLKPLTLSDVMVAFIKQENTIDHTEEYRAILGQSRRGYVSNGENETEET